MPPDEIEVNVNDAQNGKDETPVSFVESDDATLVEIGSNKESRQPDEDERWRRAEDNQARLAQNFEDLRSRLSGGSPAPVTSPPQADPWKAQEEAISERERALGISWEAHKAARTLTPDLLKEFDQKSRELQQQRIDIATQRSIQGVLPSLLRATQEQHYQAKYADVRSNAAANRWARGHYDMLVAQGAPESEDTVERAMNAARAQFRLGGYRMKPNEQDRQQFTGFSGQSRAASEPKSNVVKMGKAEKNMAMAMYGDRFNGDEKKAYAQWAKGPGVRAQKAAQKARRQSF